MINFIIKKPIMTEKNSIMAQQNTYVFEVDRKANKTEIREAIEKGFHVKVAEVRTANCRGRSTRTKLGRGPVPYWKKAMVKLKAGEKISLFEGA